ncbi:MAG TPA: hypothetical protein VFC81_02585, partial [Verrucomicrobiae bacterium]|nr:hypothetical protein [Verrucomicrobiae bacterium]
GSGTRFVFEASALPALEGALDLARAGIETGGAGHNRRFVAPSFELDPATTPERVTLAFDPQTSGGLLAAIEPAQLEAVEAGLAAVGVASWRVGRVDPASGDAGPGVVLVP